MPCADAIREALGGEPASTGPSPPPAGNGKGPFLWVTVRLLPPSHHLLSLWFTARHPTATGVRDPVAGEASHGNATGSQDAPRSPHDGCPAAGPHTRTAGRNVPAWSHDHASVPCPPAVPTSRCGRPPVLHRPCHTADAGRRTTQKQKKSMRYTKQKNHPPPQDNPAAPRTSRHQPGGTTSNIMESRGKTGKGRPVPTPVHVSQRNKRERQQKNDERTRRKGLKEKDGVTK